MLLPVSAFYLVHVFIGFAENCRNIWKSTRQKWINALFNLCSLWVLTFFSLNNNLFNAYTSISTKNDIVTGRTLIKTISVGYFAVLLLNDKCFASCEIGPLKEKRTERKRFIWSLCQRCHILAYNRLIILLAHFSALIKWFSVKCWSEVSAPVNLYVLTLIEVSPKYIWMRLSFRSWKWIIVFFTLKPYKLN